MFSFSYKDRIAFNYILSTGLLISVVFIVIYQSMKYNVNTHINEDIQTEVQKHLEEIEIDRNNTYLIQVGTISIPITTSARAIPSAKAKTLFRL